MQAIQVQQNHFGPTGSHATVHEGPVHDSGATLHKHSPAGGELVLVDLREEGIHPV